MNKKILFSVLLIALILPSITYAQRIEDIFAAAATVVLNVATYIVIILWVVTGILYLLALGDPGKLKTANGALLTSVAGTIVVVLAHLAVPIIKNTFNIN